MLKIIVLTVSAFLFSCAHQGINTVPVELFKGVTIDFPANELSKVAGDDISFYGKDGYLGFVNKEHLPKEDQPAVDFIKRGLAMTKSKNKEYQEVSKGDFIGFITYFEGSATLHLASSKNPSLVFTISTQKESIGDVLSTLKTNQ